MVVSRVAGRERRGRSFILGGWVLLPMAGGVVCVEGLVCGSGA